MRARFRKLVRGLFVIGLASNAFVVVAQEETANAVQGEEPVQAATPRPASGSAANSPRPDRPRAARASAASDAASSVKADDAIPVPPETQSVTQHSIKLDGTKIDYTATAGNLLLRNNAGQAEASIFYVAYTSDAKHAASRPETRAYIESCHHAARALRARG
jgi:carboxypeptidase C (cathepsin A)